MKTEVEEKMKEFNDKKTKQPTYLRRNKRKYGEIAE